MDLSFVDKMKSLFLRSTNGGLAQLARALAWHARGHRFDSVILHKSLKEHLHLMANVPFLLGSFDC